MSEDQIRFETREQIAFLTLNRPEKMNAITPRMAELLAEIGAQINRDPAIKVVLLEAAGGRAFSAGSDIKALDGYKSAFDFRDRTDYAMAIRNIRKPVVAALQGWVLGGGLEIALAADIRVAGQSARFGAPEVKHGWVGGGGASQLLPRLVGYGQAMKLLLTGRDIDCAEALRIGIVDVVAEDISAEDTALTICRQMVDHDTVALQAVKAAVRASLSTSLDQGLRYENELTSLCFAIGNYKDGVETFSEQRRPPVSK